jgi:hypothetical protein
VVVSKADYFCQNPPAVAYVNAAKLAEAQYRTGGLNRRT